MNTFLTITGIVLIIIGLAMLLADAFREEPTEQDFHWNMQRRIRQIERDTQREMYDLLRRHDQRGPRS